MQDINKQFYNYLWAYVLVALSGCLGNVVDGIIVGNLISADGVSAINLSKPINQFIFTLHLLINAGAGMLVAYALGQKDVLQARRYFSFSLSLSVGLGLLLALFGGVFFVDATTRLLCSNEQIMPLARDYARVLLLGNPAFILMWGLSTMVVSTGSLSWCRWQSLSTMRSTSAWTSSSSNGSDGASRVRLLPPLWAISWASPSC